MLLHFALVLHFAAILITFCVNITFCGDCYILRGPTNYNQWQNGLRHFALKWAFLRFTDFKRGKYSLSSPIPFIQCCAMFELPRENNKHANFEWRGPGRGVDSFVLWSYSIWVQCLNIFVTDCRHLSHLAARCGVGRREGWPFWQIIEFITILYQAQRSSFAKYVRGGGGIRICGDVVLLGNFYFMQYCSFTMPSRLWYLEIWG